MAGEAQAHEAATKRARSAAEEFAARMRTQGHGLDFSEASVRILENVVDAHAELRVPDDYADLRSSAPAATLDFIARAGAYLGEVARRHRGGNWGAASGSQSPFPVVRDVAGRPGQIFDPFRVIFDAVGAGDGGIVVARYMMMGGKVPDMMETTQVSPMPAMPPPVPSGAGAPEDGAVTLIRPEGGFSASGGPAVARQAAPAVSPAPARISEYTPAFGPVESHATPLAAPAAIDAVDLVPLQLPIGEILVAEFSLARGRVDEALLVQRERGGLLGELLVGMRATTEDDVLQALSRQLGAPYLDTIEVDSVEADLTQRVPIAFAKQFHVLPLRRQNGGFQVATANPLDVVPLDDLRIALGGEIYPVAAPERVITGIINTVYDRGAGAAEAAEDLEADFQGGVEPVADIDLLDASDEAPIIRLINSLLYQAVKERASDIHIEPMEREILVRFRVDGVLREVVKPPKRAQASISSRVKIMAGLNIAEKRLPQDGRIRVKIAGRDIDIRVSTLPTAHGEGVVMRLLDRSAYQLDLGAIGFTEKKRRAFESLITAPNGIVLVTGPTGSGKTTTLYAALTTINSPELKILTVEDPVEYQLKGVNQVQVNPKIDLTFATALRSFLRQDPDVILVGEIRDPVTAEVAIQASLTGHLVLSTVHTNDAPGAVTRLVDMGVEPFLVSTTLMGVMAQRLVRTLCKDCRQPYTPKDEELRQLGVEPDWFFGRGGTAPAICAEDDTPLEPGKMQLFHARGCSKCNHVGYVGRTGIYELAMIDDEIKTAILRSADGVTLRKLCIAGGMTPLIEDGALKVLHGVTTAEEVISAARDVQHS